MKKKTQKYIIILLVIVLLATSFGCSIASIISTNQNSTTDEIQEEIQNTTSYAEKLQTILNDAIKNKNLIKESVLNDLIKRNEAGDYALNTTIDILGTPVCVLESYDSVSVNVYSNENEIIELLNNISKNTNYTSKSFIQLYWMKENGETIITWIALNEKDMSEVKTVGIITSQYQKLEEMDLQVTNVSIEDVKDLSLDRASIISTYNPLVYNVQNKLLECQFITNLMENKEYEDTWYEYVIKNKDGYLYLDTQNDKFYMVYQEYSEDAIKDFTIYDDETLGKIKNGMTIEEFLKVVPNAKLYEVYLYKNTTTYTSYVVRPSGDELTIKYYDFKDGILDLSDTTTNSDEIEPTKTSSTNELETMDVGSISSNNIINN